MNVLSDYRAISQAVNCLIRKYDSVRFAVAWASVDFAAFKALCDKRDKIVQGIVARTKGVTESAGINRLGIGMRESYRGDLASNSGLQPYAGGGNVAGVASVRGSVGQLWSSEIITFACRSCPDLEKATRAIVLTRRVVTRRGGVSGTCACVDIPSARTRRSCWFPS